MAKMLIKPVDDNKGKCKTYRMLLSKYNESMENGYYGEAELIVYAFLEDRLRSLIYYFGALDNRNALIVNDDMAVLMGDNVSIKNISVKIRIIRKLLSLVSDKTIESDFADDVRKIVRHALQVSEVKKILKQIENWCDFRNQIIHALFNKDMDDLRAKYEEHVKEGYFLGRCIDRYVDAVKEV